MRRLLCWVGLHDWYETLAGRQDGVFITTLRLCVREACSCREGRIVTPRPSVGFWVTPWLREGRG